MRKEGRCRSGQPDPERHRDALRVECWPNQGSYSQTTRYRLPGSLMFLQTSGLCGSEEDSGGLAARHARLFDVLRLAVRRGSSRSGSCGATGNTLVSICGCCRRGGSLSKNRLASSDLGIITVPSSLCAQPLPNSNASPRKKGSIRPNISITLGGHTPACGSPTTGAIDTKKGRHCLPPFRDC